MIRLLLVSEPLLLRGALRCLLQDAGIAVVSEAGTCAEALSLVRSGNPDIVLADVSSAEDPLGFIEQLADASESSRVVALWDAAALIDRSVLLELGAVGVVLKQDRPEVLIHAIRKVHAGELWLDRVNTAAALSRVLRRGRVADVEAERISRLTKRERAIISLVGDGLKNAAIAESLSISEATVRNHLTSIFDKLDVDDRFELVVYAFKRGLVRYEGRRVGDIAE
jgi:DNA-binding NarL/FixJ family response regulator